jgi:Ribonuclease G/E
VTEELNEIFNEALYKAYMACQKYGHIELKQGKVTCPSCGTVGKTVKTESGIVKCPKCYRTFYWKADQWNCTCYQRQLETQRREERIRFNQKVQKEVEERLRDMHEKTDTEIENFKKNEMAICKASIRNSMPRFYRWLVSDYLE